MATRDAGPEGAIANYPTTNPSSTVGRFVTFGYQPTFYGQTYLTLYKMMGRCSIDTWDYWENITGNEAGRTIHGTQEAGTVVAARTIPIGF